ncbi:transposase [Anatilimnocola floriformis]|uniref:transposase n=1 Tax=Anatilimnocola floriformis TaxID=2948575 RepID=UPI0020C57E4D|nr:transposase [Anatilimnocola floriformis]
MTSPTYTPPHVTAAYQLQWSYSIFWHETPTDFEWLETLKSAVEPDGLHLLKHHFEPPHTSQFLISSLPAVTPLLIAQRVKGRLQHLLRLGPRTFRRNYALRSVGSTKREKVEAYVASQLRHHPLADPRVAARFEKYQIHSPAIDLAAPQETAHARYWYNLHCVFVMRDRERHVQETTLSTIQTTLIKAAEKKEHRLSRAGILPDHIHLAVGCNLHESPEEIVLSYMNNLAYATKTALFDFGYWVGTFGEYDCGAIE